MAQAAWDANPRGALGPGGQVLPAAAHRRGHTPRSRRGGAADGVDPGQAGVEAQDQLCGEAAAGLAPTCCRHGPSCPDAVQAGSGGTSAVGAVPSVPQFLLASRQLALAATRGRAEHRAGLGQAVAATNAGDGRWAPRSGLELERSPEGSRAAGATRSGWFNTWNRLRCYTAAGSLRPEAPCHMQGGDANPVEDSLHGVRWSGQTDAETSRFLNRTLSIHD